METIITLQILWIGGFLLLSCLAYFLFSKGIEMIFKSETNDDN